MTEIVARRDAELESQRQTITQLTQAIQEITTVEQAKEATAIVKGLDAYANAQQSLALVNQATELRIWAERKGGEAITRRGDKLTTLAKSHGIRYADASRWVMLYLIDERLIRDYIQETVSEGGQLSLHQVISRGRDNGRKRVATGVYREITGTYTIEWRENGHKRHAWGIKDRTTAVARREQNQRLAPSRAAKRQKMAAESDLSHAYRYVRLALEASHTSVSNPLVKEAMEHLYHAEDALNTAIKKASTSAGRGADK